MQKLISAIVTFVIAFMAFAMLHHLHGLSAGGASAYFTEPASVPLILLLSLPPIQLVALGLILVFFRHVPEAEIAFPRFWVETLEAPGLVPFWERASALVALLLPPLGLLVVWVRFLAGDAWVTGQGNGALCEVGLWLGRPLEAPCEPGGLRYGDIDLADQPGNSNGVDYYAPFEPVLALVLTAVLLALTIHVGRATLARLRSAGSGTPP